MIKETIINLMESWKMKHGHFVIKVGGGMQEKKEGYKCLINKVGIYLSLNFFCFK